ncbi:MAG: putative quinol monooxygenase [Thermodesulfobacteriota bacterium]
MLILIAKFKIKPGYREEFINLSEGMLEPSRSEEGCIHYELLQDPFSPDLFTFYEKWKSQLDLDLHFEQHYFNEFVNSIQRLVEGEGDIKTFEVTNEATIT